MRRAALVALAAVVASATGHDAATHEARADASAASACFSRLIGQSYAPNQRIAATPDGGVIAAGFTYGPDIFEPVRHPFDPATWFWFASFAADGTLRWTSYAASRAHRYDAWRNPRVRDLAVGADGSVWALVTDGILPVNATDPGPGAGIEDDDDAGIVKFAADGSVVFAMNVGGSGREQPAGLALTSDGDAILVGTTDSADFPVADAFQPVSGGGKADGFVARVRGDGTGLAWSTYFGEDQTDDATAVVIDAAGDVRVAHRVVPDQDSYPHEAADDERLLGAGVSRFTPGGAFVSTIPLPHGNRGGAYAMAATSDGAIFAGGYMEYHDTREDGFVLRIDAGASSVSTVWRRPHHAVRRMSVAPDGVTLLAGGCSRSHPYDARRFLIATDLTGPARPVGTAAIDEYDIDAVPASDGSLLFLGATVLARAPATGVHAVVRWRDTRVGTTTADLEWAGIRRDVASWQIEQTGAGPYESHAPVEVIARAPGSARRIRVTGLAPGTTHWIRVVAILTSGLRIASRGEWGVTTRPRAPADVVATAGPYGEVTLEWDPAENGEEVRFEVQRRVRGGPWRHSSSWDSDARTCDPLCTPDGPVYAPAGASGVRFRVRAHLGRRVSRWTVSPRLDIPATGRAGDDRPD